MTNIQNHTTPYYENIEFSVDTATTDYNLDTQQAGFLTYFGTGKTMVRYPTWVSIRTNQTITVKLNSTSNQAITIASTDSPFVIPGVEIRNMFISNASGSTAAIKLLFLDLPY